MLLFLSLLSWAIFGAIIGTLVKVFTPGKDPSGWLKTIGIGILGSYVGGLLKWALFRTNEFSPSGILFSVLGGVIFLLIWRKFDK